MISLFPFMVIADKAVDIEGEYAASKELAQNRQKEIEKVFADILISDLGNILGVSFKIDTELKKPVERRINLMGSTLFHQVDGIPFDLFGKAAKSQGKNGITQISLNCSVLYPESEKEKHTAFFKKILAFPDKYATWQDFLARKADKYEIRRKSSGLNGEITAIEIISVDPGAGQNRLPLIESTDPGKTSSSLFLDGVDITGDGATIKSNKSTQTKKNSGFLKGVGEFFRQQKGEKKTTPTGPQPDDGPIVSKKINSSGGKDQVFCPKVNLFFIQPGSPQVQIEVNAAFRLFGSKDNPNLAKESLEKIERIGEQFFQQARKAIVRANIIRGLSPDKNSSEKPPEISDAKDPKQPDKIQNNLITPPKKDLSQVARRILDLQNKLQELVPDYIPDNPSNSDAATFESMLEKISGKTIDQIEAENKEAEEAIVSSADGSGLGIVAITTPADESVAPGEKFSLKIKVINKLESNGPAAFTLTAFDPWTGRELGRKIARSATGPLIVELELTAPPVGESSRKLDLEIVLEPFIGSDAVPKKASFYLRGNISEGDILNRISYKIFSHSSELRLTGFGLSENEREQIFEKWRGLNWKDQVRKAQFIKTFNENPADAIANVATFVETQGMKILEAKYAAQSEKQAKESEQQEKLSRLIKFYNLETSTYKRNSVIDYRIDPGYSLIDVLEDHVNYDPKTGEIIGDLDEARQAIVEEHWELMKKTMSAADRYALQAGDDGLPKIDDNNPDDIIAGLSKIKDGTDYFAKALELVKYYQQFEVLNAEQAKNMAKMLHRLAKAINDTSDLVGDSARPLAQALKEYEGFFTRAARLNNQLKSDLKVSEIPGTLGNMAEAMSDFAGKINTRFKDFRTAVNNLAETGKTAPLIRNLKKAVDSLGNILSRSLDLSSSLCRGLVRFADTIIESGLKGAGQTATKGLDAGQDASNWLTGKIVSSGEDVLDLGKSANNAADSKGFIGKLLQGIKNKTVGNEKLLNGIGHGIDAANLVLEYKTYRDAGQSETEAFSRSAISAGIEKLAGSKYSPLGLINFGLTKTMDFASSTLGINETFEKKFNMKTNQINFSTPVKIFANQSVNQIMDFYNSYVVPGQRIEKAKENEDTIIALTIAAENCLQMAKKSKNKTVQDAYMEQRKIYREEIRKLGGRSK
jgi:hypothetical protein